MKYWVMLPDGVLTVVLARQKGNFSSGFNMWVYAESMTICLLTNLDFTADLYLSIGGQ